MNRTMNARLPDRFIDRPRRQYLIKYCPTDIHRLTRNPPDRKDQVY